MGLMGGFERDTVRFRNMYVYTHTYVYMHAYLHIYVTYAYEHTVYICT